MATSLSAFRSSAVARSGARQPCRPSARTAVCVKAVKAADNVLSRRELLAASAGVALLFTAQPAQAFLGFGDDEALQKNYADETTAILGKVRDTLALAKDDPSKEDRVKELRKDINSWVAKYRREPKVSGKPSFGNTYSALNALAGHYNSFGAQAPIPKKRLERLVKELDDATLFLSRNR